MVRTGQTGGRTDEKPTPRRGTCTSAQKMLQRAQQQRRQQRSTDGVAFVAVREPWRSSLSHSRVQDDHCALGSALQVCDQALQ